jgi:hypothetical protein
MGSKGLGKDASFIRAERHRGLIFNPNLVGPKPSACLPVGRGFLPLTE